MNLTTTTLALAMLLASTAHAANNHRVAIPGLRVTGSAPIVPVVPVEPVEPGSTEPPAAPVITDLTLSGPLNFGQVFAGGSSSLALTITNPASNPSVTITGLTINNAAFEVDTTCVAALAPGQQCTASVTFAPTQTNSYSANLTVGFGSARTVSTTLQGVAQANLVNVSGARQWSDGTLASSCNAYRTPTVPYVYQGATGDGVYRITPEGGSTQSVYCDMTTDGGGWTLVARWTDFGPDPIPQGSVLVRGASLAGYTNDASRPIFTGTNRFANMRLDHGNAVWNSIYGTSPTAGLKFPTYAAWPVITIVTQFRVGATNLNGPTVPATATVSLSSGPWFAFFQYAADPDWPFGLFTVEDNTGVCGGGAVVATQNICMITTYVGTGVNDHMDITSTKHLWGR